MTLNIDDPIKAAETLIASEERQRSPVFERIAEGLAAVGFPGADKTKGYLESRRAENRDLLLSVLCTEVRRLDMRLGSLSAEHLRFLVTDFAELLADGLRKAEDIRDRGRVEWLATILSTAALKGPAFPPDETEEMMRVARELEPNDLLVLRHLNESFGKGPGSQIRHENLMPDLLSNDAASLMGIGDLPLTDDSHSSCLKLQSFGLAAASASSTDTRFRILEKGVRFLRYLQEA